MWKIRGHDQTLPLHHGVTKVTEKWELQMTVARNWAIPLSCFGLSTVDRQKSAFGEGILITPPISDTNDLSYVNMDIFWYVSF